MLLVLGLESLALDNVDADPVSSPSISLAYPLGFEPWTVCDSTSGNGPLFTNPEVVLETRDRTNCSSGHEIISSKNACDEDIILVDLAIKCKRKKGVAIDKKKKRKSWHHV